MPGADDGLGKKAEAKIKLWLDRPEDGYCFYRIKDQMTGFYGSSNICDFIVFKSPNQYFVESKATWHDRFEFSRITDIQRNGLLEVSKVDNVFGLVIVLFASHQRAFVFDINDIVRSQSKSVNITKINKWTIPYYEIPTIVSRKQLLDYSGELKVPERNTNG